MDPGTVKENVYGKFVAVETVEDWCPGCWAHDDEEGKRIKERCRLFPDCVGVIFVPFKEGEEQK